MGIKPLLWVEEGLGWVSTVLGDHAFPQKLCIGEVVKSSEQLSVNAVQSEWAKHALSIGRNIKVLFALEFAEFSAGTHSQVVPVGKADTTSAS